MRVRACLSAVLAMLLAAPAAAQDAHHGPGAGAAGGRVGILIADHGEPPEYNELTYYSFREFLDHLIEMGIIPSWIKALDQGTIVQDRDCYDCDEARTAPKLIDAWLRPHQGPGTYVPRSDSLPAYYFIPGGPGQGEPDIFEHGGLQMWDEYRRMGGRSPNYDQKLPKKLEVERRLREAYGGRIAVRVGYGIDPRINATRQGLRDAVDALVTRDRARSIVVAYHGVGFSDIMQTHMVRHEIAEAARELDPAVTVSFAEPVGKADAYVRSTVDKVRRELEALPAGAPVAVHLSGHGLPTTTCGDYDCGADAYHAHSRDLFARTRAALEAAIDRPGRTGIFHIYGDGATGDDDPKDVVDGPLEALDKRVAEGYRYVVDVPYEFDADSRDTLIVLRDGYGREAPEWDEAYESRFDYRGLRVKIANASHGEAAKTEAFEQVILRVAVPLLGPPASARPAGTAHAAHPAPAKPPTPHVESVAAPAAHDAAVSAPPTDERHGALAAQPRSELARHASGAARRPLEPIALLLVALAGAALGWGLMGRRANARTLRVSAGALALQLGGLGWDVAAHAAGGEPMHVLENGGHWLVLGGLVLLGASALLAGARPMDQPRRQGA